MRNMCAPADLTKVSVPQLMIDSGHASFDCLLGPGTGP